MTLAAVTPWKPISRTGSTPYSSHHREPGPLDRGDGVDERAVEVEQDAREGLAEGGLARARARTAEVNGIPVSLGSPPRVIRSGDRERAGSAPRGGMCATLHVWQRTRVGTAVPQWPMDRRGGCDTTSCRPRVAVRPPTAAARDGHPGADVRRPRHARLSGRRGSPLRGGRLGCPCGSCSTPCRRALRPRTPGGAAQRRHRPREQAVDRHAGGPRGHPRAHAAPGDHPVDLDRAALERLLRPGGSGGDRGDGGEDPVRLFGVDDPAARLVVVSRVPGPSEGVWLPEPGRRGRRASGGRRGEVQLSGLEDDPGRHHPGRGTLRRAARRAHAAEPCGPAAVDLGAEAFPSDAEQPTVRARLVVADLATTAALAKGDR